MIRKITTLLFAFSGLALAVPAMAQTDLTCDDISFSPELTSTYPEIHDACRDVVEINGERFAKMTVEVMKTRRNHATFRFKEPDGDYGPIQSVDLDPSWRANVEGRDYRIEDVGRGTELNIYIPADRWEVHVARSEMEVVTVWYGVTMYEDDMEEPAALPMTASLMPLLGLLGGTSLCVAFLMRVSRRRSI